MATNMQNKLEYSNLLYCNTIVYNQKVLCIASEVETKIQLILSAYIAYEVFERGSNEYQRWCRCHSSKRRALLPFLECNYMSMNVLNTS